MSDAPYDVGYGKPPRNTRFAPGHSGNPRGRPKGTRNLATMLSAILNERVAITENGKRRSITKLEATLKQLVNRGASGDAKATAALIALIQASEAKPPDAAAYDDMADDAVIQEMLRRLSETQA